MKNIITLVISVLLSGGGTWIFKDFKVSAEKKALSATIKEKSDSLTKVKNIAISQEKVINRKTTMIDSLKADIEIHLGNIGQLQKLNYSTNTSLKIAKQLKIDCENYLSEAVASGVVRRDTVQLSPVYLNIFGKPSKSKNKKN